MLIGLACRARWRLGDREAARALRDEAVRDGRRRRPRAARSRRTSARSSTAFAARAVRRGRGARRARASSSTGAYPAAVASDDLPILGRRRRGRRRCWRCASGEPAGAAEMLGARMRLRGTDDLRNPETRALLDELRAAARRRRGGRRRRGRPGAGPRRGPGPARSGERLDAVAVGRSASGTNTASRPAIHANVHVRCEPIGLAEQQGPLRADEVGDRVDVGERLQPARHRVRSTRRPTSRSSAAARCRNMIPCTAPGVRARMPTNTEIQQKHSAKATASRQASSTSGARRSSPGSRGRSRSRASRRRGARSGPCRRGPRRRAAPTGRSAGCGTGRRRPSRCRC